VAPEDIEVQLERAALTVSAKRRLGFADREAVIRRLEIPHGRFVRQIALSGPPLRIADTSYLNGCLEVRLVWAEGVR
jgi:HSP20 family molecular chaperone IbpA